MAELLKDLYNREFLHNFSRLIRTAWSKFNSEAFIAAIMDSEWPNLTLKERMRKISIEIGKHLPSDYEKAIAILFKIDSQCNGFTYLVLPDFVAVHGLEEKDFELSMEALGRFTSGSSSEFAIRPFILKYTEKTMQRMEKWAESNNEHQRRLASEGARPRLPWGESLPIFKKNPSPVLVILEKLKADESLYVRKSVANNLNDISKDHPDIVLETAARWKGKNPHTNWIIKRACRTLIKKADERAMSLFSYSSDHQIKVEDLCFKVSPLKLTQSDSCLMNYEFKLDSKDTLSLRLEYGIDFVRSGGKTSRKNFLIAEQKYPPGSVIRGIKKHSWKELTTRKHYSGIHKITFLINGKEFASESIELKTDKEI